MEVRNGKNIMGLPKAGKACGDIMDARAPINAYVVKQHYADGDYLSRSDAIASKDARALSSHMSKQM